MQKRHFGPLETLVPVIGQGTWRMEKDNPVAAERALRRGIDLGMTHIDTAELYGAGIVEELVGRAIAGLRAEVFLASKVQPEHATYAGTILACERSLQRLKTDHLDLYLLHWRGNLPIEESLRAMATLRAEGKIRAFGVSNFDVADLEQAIELAGEGEIACNQVLYHLGERDIEHVLLPFCERHKIAVVGYSPFGSGDFAETGSWRRSVLEKVARAHHATAYAVALRFLVRRPALFTIPKASTTEHVEANADAGDLVLSDAEIAEISAAFPLGEPKSRMPYM
jgi:diketogulonate reductase-like aldo/keto reductase